MLTSFLASLPALAAPLLGLDVRGLADGIGYPAAALGILIESSGIPFPGELTLLAVSAYAASGHLNIAGVIAMAALGSVLGADLGYLFGLRGGRPFVERIAAFLRINPSHIGRAEGFFEEHGEKTILAGRFILGLRTWASVFAGAAHMPFWRFQLYSIIGGTAWAILFGTLGYVLGNNWNLLTTVVSYLGYGGLALVIIAVLTFLLLRRRASRSGRPPDR